MSFQRQSGKVIDIDVMSSYCKSCEVSKKLYSDKSKSSYQQWQSHHAKSCQKNHFGSAGKMEVEGMKKIFRRSVAERGVRYLSYIGDGDASTFKDVCEDKPYGINTTIEKVECVGHVQKRMGTRLRKLKKDMKRKKLADGKTIGGRGRLTDELIKKLTTYYGNAIRKNKNNLFSMRKDIWAIWMHFVSTDADPQHHFCPTGETSWCKYNQAKFKNSLEKFKHKSSVPRAVMDMIKPIFKAYRIQHY
ncbi:hypothetical protein AVEN_216071-1 [Araneus ventricosus]|uniref:Mutator-like transposase domain-containing protein n=1 Tax=Araneus ventricosus TaxID=182803 RepID=A0A4Y2I6T8_ARAVE|nr:hypothetical protein AVEN_216071-1 [Araneus ventricosus]